jgi:hypothetical protein
MATISKFPRHLVPLDALFASHGGWQRIVVADSETSLGAAAVWSTEGLGESLAGLV